MPEFIAYVGPPELHDANVRHIARDGTTCVVDLESHDGAPIRLVFVNVLAVHSNNAEGMLIYALSELRHEPPHRRFAFGNWNEDDPSMLEVVAEKFTVANLEAS